MLENQVVRRAANGWPEDRLVDPRRARQVSEVPPAGRQRVLHVGVDLAAAGLGRKEPRHFVETRVGRRANAVDLRRVEFLKDEVPDRTRQRLHAFAAEGKELRLAHPEDHVVQDRHGLLADQAAARRDLIKIVDVGQVDVLHRPEREVGPDQALLRPLQAAHDAAALGQAVRARLIGYQRDPLIEVVDVAPADEQVILHAGKCRAQRHDLSLRHRQEDAVVGDGRLRNNLRQLKIGCWRPLIDWASGRHVTDLNVHPVGICDQNFAPVVERPVGGRQREPDGRRGGRAGRIAAHRVAARRVAGAGGQRAVGYVVRISRVAAVDCPGSRGRRHLRRLNGERVGGRHGLHRVVAFQQNAANCSCHQHGIRFADKKSVIGKSYRHDGAACSGIEDRDRAAIGDGCRSQCGAAQRVQRNDLVCRGRCRDARVQPEEDQAADADVRRNEHRGVACDVAAAVVYRAGYGLRARRGAGKGNRTRNAGGGRVGTVVACGRNARDNDSAADGKHMRSRVSDRGGRAVARGARRGGAETRIADSDQTVA
ncbi:unannotated protein [freshwater metagenome]|uniref:Unannotated protein n=1 Tax=freshwater metagenome TaxID=449393 RepID=A0A6J6Z5R5_9ZZZZ